ncbi:MAG: hypothetical protein KDA92_15730 [Planctomycetales bacterium]|nr:hypothetical protein [Planctomycetales bacterium]
MASKRLALVHTSATLVPVFAALCKDRLPDVDVINLVDDSLIKDVIAQGELRPSVARRVARAIASAEDAGADLILVTCSSIGSAVETAASLSSVQVLRVDRPMAELAVASAERIGVIATLSTTLDPTVDLIRRCAAAAGKQVEISARLCEGAFPALMNGDGAKHDELVSAQLKTLLGQVDVIVLAQASIARVVESLDDADHRVPILASPPTAIDRVSEILL